MLVRILFINSLILTSLLFASEQTTNKQKVVKSNKEKILNKYDKNHDGIITFDELPKNMIDNLSIFDFNKNGKIENSELNALN